MLSFDAIKDMNYLQIRYVIVYNIAWLALILILPKDDLVR